MAIQYQENGKISTLHTDHSTYQTRADSYGNLLYLYYGDGTEGSMEYLLTFGDWGLSPNPYEAGDDRTYSLDVLLQGYLYQGSGDSRSPTPAVERADESYGLNLHYGGHEISKGKCSLPGLPSMYGEGLEDVRSLKIHLTDQVSGLAVTLLYGIFPGYDTITRAVCVENEGNSPAALKRVYSVCLDFLHGEYDLIQFYGRHAAERNFQRTALCHGARVTGSHRGTSSHQYNPPLILAGRETTENYGPCYSMSFMYSGAFKVEVETGQHGQTRMSMGLQDEMFSYKLKPGGIFFGPEVIMGYSSHGLGTLSRSIHKAMRRSPCRGKYKTTPRPVLINNWEVTYFDFTGEKILDTVRQTKELGVEMMVLDDGWFGKRDPDCSGLGDWQANVKKPGGSLGSLISRVSGLGMKFGIRTEPEMVSEDSSLYREHPDWALAVLGRKPVRGRSQLVLDLSRKEVADYISDSICRVLDNVHIEYLKRDMNRSVVNVHSAAGKMVGGDSPGSILYRYTLGLYDFLEYLTKRYLDLLTGGCSDGGGRSDAGMLYYTPQIWRSDSTDAVDRIRIQYGTLFGYLISVVGSHVPAVPNHQTGRIIPMKTRGVAAMMGSFGYELNLSTVSEEDKNCVREQIDMHHKYWYLIRDGAYYRLTNPFEDKEVTVWLFVSEDKGEALSNTVALETHGNPLSLYIPTEGLDPEIMYRDEDTGTEYPGAGLMSAGIPIPSGTGEYQAFQVHLRRIRRR